MSEENLVRQLMASAKCDVCGRSFEEDDIKILGHDENIWVLEVNCGTCHAQSMLAALKDEEVVEKSVEEISDLLETELEQFGDVVITGDDVLDMHIFLENFEGDIFQLLGRSNS